MWSRVSVVTKPTLQPVTAIEAKPRTRIDSSDDDTDIDSMIEEAVGAIERSNGLALMQQTWRLSLDRFAAEINLPGWPIKSITSVKYLDADEAEQTAASSLYRLEANASPARLVLTKDSAWPAIGPFRGAVTIDYVLGESSAASVPAELRAAVLLLVTHKYDNREAVSSGEMKEIPFAIENITREYRQSWAAA